MKRRVWNNSSTPTHTRRKPEWNTYLTDDAQYKLNQQQQLQRALQQLSTAHFSGRSPAASTSRRRLKAANAHSSAWSTPRKREKDTYRATHLDEVKDTGELNTQRRLQFDVSTDLEETTPRRRAGRANTVSFQEAKMDSKHKMTLQTELEVLEKMLWQLETETESCTRFGTPLKTTTEEEEIVQHSDGCSEPEEERDEIDMDARLEDICYKSLEIGLELARRVDSLKTQVDSDQKLRVDRELQINMLTQEVRSTQAKCNYLEAKYQSMAAEVDDMRDAVIATEQAIHRMTLALENSQRRRVKSSYPTTPRKPGDNVQVSSQKGSTPKKQSNVVEQQENIMSNGQRGN
ncbi:hypothetical protein Plhal304r1_c050g0132311 [Plasmopara halstedii]